MISFTLNINTLQEVPNRQIFRKLIKEMTFTQEELTRALIDAKVDRAEFLSRWPWRPDLAFDGRPSLLSDYYETQSLDWDSNTLESAVEVISEYYDQLANKEYS